MNRYHAYNGIFSEQPLRSSIEDYNQTIKFCGVVYHHKYSIFERKIQALKLGDITLLLHENIYCPEAITTILWPYALKEFSEQLNVIKVDNDGITPMEKFEGT